MRWGFLTLSALKILFFLCNATKWTYSVWFVSLETLQDAFFENLTSQKVRSVPYGEPVEVWVGVFPTLSASKVLFFPCNTMKWTYSVWFVWLETLQDALLKIWLHKKFGLILMVTLWRCGWGVFSIFLYFFLFCLINIEYFTPECLDTAENSWKQLLNDWEPLKWRFLGIFGSVGWCGLVWGGVGYLVPPIEFSK